MLEAIARRLYIFFVALVIVGYSAIAVCWVGLVLEAYPALMTVLGLAVVFGLMHIWGCVRDTDRRRDRLLVSSMRAADEASRQPYECARK